MNLFLLGLNHRTAPVEVRERMNIPEEQLAQALRELMRRPGIREGLILSTCNRVEVITNTDEGVDGEPIVREFLADRHRCDLTLYESHFYRFRHVEAVTHLFRVASSLDSMIVGEPQILGQVKRAYERAREADALSGELREIMLQTLGVAKRVRTETAIGEEAVSVSYAAVELAQKIFGSLEGKTVFVVGSGKMSEAAAKHLLHSGAHAVFVSHRTHERAEKLAQLFEGSAIRFDEFFAKLPQADIVISSASAAEFVITREQAERALAARKNRPMFFVDIGVPRNIDPAVNGLDNAFLYDIDDLGRVVEANRKQREREAVWAEAIVHEEVERTMRRLASREVIPTIVALERRLELIRTGEIERFRGKLGSLTEDQMAAVDALTRGIQNKILRGPVVELKNGVGHPEHGAVVQLIRKIFGVAE